ncbi:MAG: CinA family nicotinamide mononucleotide deamidase-related protein [Actinomycetia bacterium]|nr:CinA family nicotinamide mononucleotide deamidase-related protein [Actinomycetes bacterium]MCP4961358.1 CinA family nicotinamide mononucleotide deamidase-related protein [Actinomycetes bacterium]
MKCEVVAVGTELLLGQIVDTNSSWIGEQLAAVGIDSHFQTKVGDNPRRIADALRLALSRSDAVIVSGGLGPTQDDITRDVIAEVMGVELVHDEMVAAKIREMFSSRGREMPANNLRQALVPDGASTMDEQPGTAPGLVCPMVVDGVDKVVYAVPGVPMEMRQMVGGTVMTDLRRRAGDDATIASRVIRTWGNSESGLAEVLADHIDRLDSEGHATLAFLASGVEGLKVRITAKGPDQASVSRLLDAEEAEVRAALGDIVFGVDDDTMESVVLAGLARSGQTLAVAETISGGYMASRLTPAPGSHVLLGAVVATGDAVRQRLYRLAEVEVADSDRGSVAEAAALAEGVRQMFDADVGLATAGLSDTRRPSGEVAVAIATSSGVDTVEWRLPRDHDRVRQFSCIGLLDRVRRTVIAADGR